jgi:excisionase family DNA binding protein
MTDESPTTGEWLTLAVAAEKLGVSVDTVRRRLHRGELIAKEELTRFGKAWRVQLDELPSAGQSPTQDLPTAEQNGVHSPGQGVDGPGMLELVQLIKELQLKAETAAMWQARAMVLEEQLGHTRLQLTQAYETLKALEAPKLLEDDIKEEPPPESESWWGTWWRRLGLG